MKHILLCSIVCVLALSCNFGATPCTQNSDCGDGSCEQNLKICVSRDGGNAATGGGSTVTGGGSAVTGGGTTVTGGGSAVTGGGSAVTGGGTAVTGGGTAVTGGGTAVIGGGTAVTGGGTAVTGGGTAVTGGGTAITGGGTAVTGGGSAVTGGGSAVTGGGTAVTGGGSAVTGGGTAVTGGGSAVTGGGSGCLSSSLQITAPDGSPLAWPSEGYRRDELVAIKVSLDPRVTTAPSVQLNSFVFTAISCGTTFWCATLDFSKPPFSGLNGTFILRVREPGCSIDVPGSTVAIPVTRVRTSATLLPPTQWLAAPAVDSTGSLIVGNSSQLMKIDPSSMTSLWRVDAGTVVSVATAYSNTSGPYVYYNAQSTALQGLLAVRSSSNGALISSPCTSPHFTTSSIALFQTNSQTLAAGVFSIEGALSGPRVCSVSPTWGCGACLTTSANLSMASGSNVVAHAGRLYFQNESTTPISTSWDFNGSITSSFTATTPFGTDGGIVRSFGMAASSDDFLFASSLRDSITGPFDIMRPTLFPAGLVTLNDAGTVTAGPPIVVSGIDAGVNTAIFAAANKLYSVTVTKASGAVTNVRVINLPTGFTPATSPVAGSRKNLYIVSHEGVLAVYRFDQNGVINTTPWLAQLPLPTDGGVVAHPTLDCSRPGGNGNRPGSLYVLDSNGGLLSIIVDDEGLDETAPWPKWQRTSNNAGTTDPGFSVNDSCTQ